MPAIGKIVLAFSLLISSIFMVDHINVRSFWLDEASVGNLMRFPISSLWQKSLTEGHPLSYIYSLKLWSIFFEDSEVALRSFSVLSTLLVIIVLYKAAKEFFPESKVYLLAPFLAATNYFLIWHSTQTKGYPFVALLGILSFYFFWKLKTVPYIVFTILGLYSHPWFFLMFGTQMGISFFRNKKMILTQFFICLLSIPSLISIFSLTGQGASDWEGLISISVLWESLKYITLNQSFIYFGALITACYYVWLQKDIKISSVFSALVIYAILPPVLAVFLSLFSPAYVVGRYEVMIMPALVLIMAWFFSNIKNNFIQIIIAGLLIISAFQAVIQDREAAVNLAKYDDRVAANQLFQKIKNGDTVITTDMSYSSFDYYFYHLNIGPEKKQFTFISFPDEISKHPAWRSLSKMLLDQPIYQQEAENLVSRIVQSKSSESSVWVIYYSPSPTNRLLYDELNKKLRLTTTMPPPLIHQPLWFDEIYEFR